MTRALQDRLALANIKINRGWENRSLNSIEPELEQELKRKRTASNADILSDTSSSIFSSALPISSPVTAPILSDDLPLRSGSSQGSAKRFKINPNRSCQTLGARKRLSSQRSRASTSTWKATHQLPESSPTFRHSFNAACHPLSQPSFASATSTVIDSASASEEDDQDIPLRSFQLFEPASSPPQTPQTSPRSFKRASKLGTPPSKQNMHGTKEGADLLMFLASSPSPYPKPKRTPMHPPSTPPAKATPLPSSMMSTPGGQTVLFGYNPCTPSANFNLGDFLNVTPSPAQGAFGTKTPGRTPGGLKTPAAARETRRRLLFGASPQTGDMTPSKREDLGIDLGS